MTESTQSSYVFIYLFCLFFDLILHPEPVLFSRNSSATYIPSNIDIQFVFSNERPLII